jgi:tRNA threonylcarbamoyladenosine biosynthesis protein TsaB
VILAFETATQSVGVALADERGLVASIEVMQGRKHAETLVPAAEQLLAHVDASYKNLQAIAVDIGPGLFTGLRVGVATAKAIALACNVPVVSSSSLELLALGEATSSHGLRGDVLCVIDARRKELYAQVYRIDDGFVSAFDDPFVCPAAEVRMRAATQCTLTTVLGAGALVYADDFSGLSLKSAQPSVAVLAVHALEQQGADADSVELLYLRAPDAEINWTSR